MNEDDLFARDTEPPAIIVTTHSVYLHTNYELIIKPANYYYEPGCMASDGGFVLWVCYPSFDLDEMLNEAAVRGASKESMKRVRDIFTDGGKK